MLIKVLSGYKMGMVHLKLDRARTEIDFITKYLLTECMEVIEEERRIR